MRYAAFVKVDYAAGGVGLIDNLVPIGSSLLDCHASLAMTVRGVPLSSKRVIRSTAISELCVSKRLCYSSEESRLEPSASTGCSFWWI